MVTETQAVANRRNAQSSTGPRTEAGKSRASRNAVTLGIYSAGDFVRPEDADVYHLFCEGFQKSLRPKGALEQTLAAEIIHAACVSAAAPPSNPKCSTNPCSIPPAPQPAHHRPRPGRSPAPDATRHRQLRRLQTDRQLRVECLSPDFDQTKLGGLASMKAMQSTLAIKQRLDGPDAMSQIIRATTPPALSIPATKRTQSATPTSPDSTRATAPVVPARNTNDAAARAPPRSFKPPPDHGTRNVILSFAASIFKPSTP